jgi:hypothetical protein
MVSNTMLRSAIFGSFFDDDESKWKYWYCGKYERSVSESPLVRCSVVWCVGKWCGVKIVLLGSVL